MIDLKELRRLAEAATSGPWVRKAPEGGSGAKFVMRYEFIVADCSHRFNTEFIAAANPATVIELLDELEKFTKLYYKSLNTLTDRDEERAKLIELLRSERAFQKLAHEDPDTVLYSDISRATDDCHAALEACSDIKIEEKP